MMIFAVFSSLALAAPEEARPSPGVRLAVRGLVERYNDPALASVYKSGIWLSGLGLAVPLLGPLGVDLEGGFGRMRAEGSTFEIAPLSGLLTLSFPLGGPDRRVDGFLGAGPAWTMFGERIEGSTEGSIQGARIAGELRFGLRIDTGLIDPPSPPAPPGLLQRLELECYAARRAQFPSDAEGLLLGAWRGSLGIGLVF